VGEMLAQHPTTWQSALDTRTATAPVLSISEGSPNSYPAPSRMLHEHLSHTVLSNEHPNPLTSRPTINQDITNSRHFC
jgi:hypothetical protein